MSDKMPDVNEKPMGGALGGLCLGGIMGQLTKATFHEALDMMNKMGAPGQAANAPLPKFEA